MIPFWIFPLPLRLRLAGMLSLCLLVGNCIPNEGLALEKTLKVGQLETLQAPEGVLWEFEPESLEDNSSELVVGGVSHLTFAVPADFSTPRFTIRALSIVTLENGKQGIKKDKYVYVLGDAPIPPAPGPQPPAPGPNPVPVPADWIGELKSLMQAQLLANPPPKSEASMVATIIRSKTPSATSITTLMQDIRQTRLDAMKADRFLVWNAIIEPVGVKIESLQTAGTIKTLDDQKKAMLGVADALDAWAASSTIGASSPNYVEPCTNPDCTCLRCDCEDCKCKYAPDLIIGELIPGVHGTECPSGHKGVAGVDGVTPTEAKLDKLLESNDKLTSLLEKYLVAQAPTPAPPQKTTPAPVAAPVITRAVSSGCYTLPNGQTVCPSPTTTTYGTQSRGIFGWRR